MTQPLQVEQGAFLDFSGRTTLRVTGNDRLRFLNGQITNDVRKAGEAVAVEACVLNAKGKINAHIFVSAAPECFWIDADPELREASQPDWASSPTTLRLKTSRMIVDLSRPVANEPNLATAIVSVRRCRAGVGYLDERSGA
jgi:hypothetical protein